MDKIDKIKQELIDAINNDKFKGDLSDIGNTIGIVIGKHIDESEMGFEKDAFIHGIKHGISLSDGTH